MPDERRRPSGTPSGTPRPVDLADEYLTFLRVFGRQPDTWAEWVLGLRHAGRDRERLKLLIASAVRLGTNAKPDTWRDWYRTLDHAVN